MSMTKRAMAWYLKPKLDKDGTPVVGMDNELKVLLVLLVVSVVVCKIIQWTHHG